MIEDMDWMTIIPLIVGAISNLSALVMHAVAERLLTLVLAAAFIGGVCIFAIAAFAWLWITHAGGDLRARPRAAS